MSSVVVGSLGIIVISLGGVAVLLHDMTTVLDGWPISPLSIVLILGFAIAMYFIYLFEQKQDPGEGGTANDESGKYASENLPRHIVVYAVAALVVVGAAVWLSFVSDDLAVEMGWDASFMGTQFLAAATSLPELATSFAALRIGAPELAITNLLGSNLFNMGFVLFLDDVAHTGGPILDRSLAGARAHRRDRRPHDRSRRPSRRQQAQDGQAGSHNHRSGGADRRVRARKRASVHASGSACC